MKPSANTCRTHDPNQWNAEPKKPGKGTECVELEQLCPHVTSGLGPPWGVDTQSTVRCPECTRSGKHCDVKVVRWWYFIFSPSSKPSPGRLTPPLTLAGSPKRKGCRETSVGYEAKAMSGDGEQAWDGGEG